MDYKKSYNEALERAKAIYQDKYKPETAATIAEVLQNVFPELVESEDERMRKRLLNLFKGCPWDSIDDGMLKRDDIINWLEKQGEQKGSAKEAPDSCALSFINYLDAHRYIGKMCVSNGECEDIVDAFHNGMWDKLHRYYCKYIEKQDDEPNDEQDLADVKNQEFKEGDWIVVGNMVGQITGVQEDCYIGRDTDGWYFSLSRPEGNSNAHLWTIEDAKNGDVLARNNDILSICIFSRFDGINNKYSSFLCRCGLEGEGLGQKLSINGYHDDCKDYVPATKEQCDTLFQRIQEAGYEWDDQNKSLSKI